ncbi:helix-turn-helix domain-containing protein [Streptomyces laculatispora]|uniref:Helix-turn-helix domain-containing protein n=1 Tax=Streptomyces laculatispora TaxID=887464 RepID=A0ABY9I774_9ACTN|nr:helix-turn-helix domain-containing protein [Streptomyces laculatispora]WLQ42722.1 helix-turn-helix domain-containing protein [Streptomyces laculatispora]
MDTPQITAPPCAPPGSPGSLGFRSDVTPTSGLLHVNTRHISGFTVIGNHLAQHCDLSLIAIGLATHIQSLPAGAKVGIKILVERFPESEARIAAALRELEAMGYLHRSRVRLPDGQVITRTISYNRPGTDARTSTTPQPPAPPRPRRTAPPRIPSPAPCPAPQPAPVQAPPPSPVPSPAPPPAPAEAPAPEPPPLPQPHAPTQDLHRTAAALLADLRRHAPQLALSESDITALTPGVATWLEHDAHPDTIRHALTTDLPVPLKHPARLLRHRITTRLPAPLPGTGDLAPPRRKVVVIPLQNCDTCERAFRATEPGHCRDCRADQSDVMHRAA